MLHKSTFIYPKTLKTRCIIWSVYYGGFNHRQILSNKLEQLVIAKVVQRGRLFNKTVINNKLV